MYFYQSNIIQSDGGFWSFLFNIVSKYGVMPKSCYDECWPSLATDEMCSIIDRKVAIMTDQIRNSRASDKTLFKKVQNEMMPEIYKLMANFLGEPPKKFIWKYTTRKPDEEYKCFPEMTAMQFFEQYVNPYANINNKVCVCDDPRPEHADYTTYTYDVSNMIKGFNHSYIKMPLQVIKKAVAKSLKHKTPVYFDCDISKDFIHYLQLLDNKAINVESVLNIKLNDTKESRLRYRTGTPNHAMLITKVEIEKKPIGIVDGKVKYQKNFIKWQVENSWGLIGSGEDNCHLQMSDSWFDEYVFGCVIDLDFFPDDIKEKITNSPIVALSYTDSLLGRFG